MEIILYFFRDNITGIHYLIYAFICQFLMFSLIGYLYKQKYGKLEIKLNTGNVLTNQENVMINSNQINNNGQNNQYVNVNQTNSSNFNNDNLN